MSKELVLEDMTDESLVAYAFDCLDKCKKDGWVFDWFEYTAWVGKRCCLAGAIRVQNKEVWRRRDSISGDNWSHIDENGHIQRLSRACREAQIEYHGADSEILPTRTEVLWMIRPESSKVDKTIEV